MPEELILTAADICYVIWFPAAGLIIREYKAGKRAEISPKDFSEGCSLEGWEEWLQRRKRV